MDAVGKSFEAILHCLENFIREETVVGKPISLGQTTIIPVFRVTLGLGAGGGNSHSMSSQKGTGAGASIVPHAVISVTNGETTVHSLAGKNSLQTITEMLPEIISQAKNQPAGENA